MRKKEFVPLEAEEQAIFVQWLEGKGLKFSAIPNSTYNPHPSQQRKNYITGLRKGLPDLLVIAGGSLVFIEMKRKKGSVLLAEQEEWIKALNEIENVGAYVCYGADHAIQIIEKCL